MLPDLPSREIHHECEVALIIGKGGRHIPVADAMDHLFGYSCLIDVTVRGKEERVMRKSYDTFTPIGPALVTADEVGDPGNLDMKLWVNDELRQHASTRDLIVDIPNMIALASSVSTLEPGDVIATGTPEGVGPIRDGDKVTIEIERVGRMTVPVRQGQRRRQSRAAQGDANMNAPTREDLARSGTLEELYGKLAQVGMGAGWNKPTPSLWASPRKTFRPTHWSYAQARGALDAAGRLINTELAERRNLILFNPAEGNTYGTVRTLVAAYQMIMPGEWARVHRHTPNALRLILDAEPGTYTEVDGVNIAMEPGDVLLTPNWSTHGHGNNSKAECLLARLPRRAAGAAAGADVLRAARRGREPRGVRARAGSADQGVVVRVHARRDRAAPRLRRSRHRRVRSAPRSSSATRRSTPPRST